MPTAAGLSSSSSGTMALVLACNEYFKLNKSTQEMVEIAKEGSGSSCRSFYRLAAWLEDGSVEEHFLQTRFWYDGSCSKRR